MNSLFQSSISIALLGITVFTSFEIHAAPRSHEIYAKAESESQEGSTKEHKLLFGNGKLLHKIKHLVKAHDFIKLGKLLRKVIKKTDRIEEVRLIAREIGAPLLLRAMDAAAALSSITQGQGLDLSPGELAQISLFIEADFPLYRKNGIFYIPKRATGLSCTIEYDPVTQARFIVLDKDHDAFLGEGKCKAAFKAIFYNIRSPKIVVRTEQQTSK